MSKEINASHAIPFICMYPYKNVEMPGRDFELTIIIADAASESVRNRLCNQCRKLKEKKVFTIVIFIARQNDLNPDIAIESGADAWFVTTSKNEADEIADSIQSIVDVNGLINLDANDVKTILYGSKHGNGLSSVNKRACFACGEDVKGNFEVALSNAIDYAKKRGQDIYDYNKVLISIDYNSNLLTEQMNSLNKFMDRLAEKHENDLEIKWGVAMRQDLPERTVRITMLAK